MYGMVASDHSSRYCRSLRHFNHIMKQRLTCECFGIHHILIVVLDFLLLLSCYYTPAAAASMAS